MREINDPKAVLKVARPIISDKRTPNAIYIFSLDRSINSGSNIGTKGVKELCAIISRCKLLMTLTLNLL